MRVAIVYDSSTGNTKAAARAMAEVVREAGHECSVESVAVADPVEVSAADAVCVGSWTKGLFVVAQRPTEASLEFIDQLDRLDGKPAAVFATYSLAAGRTLTKLAAPLERRGAQVSGRFKSKGPHIAPGFETWVRSLGATQRS